MADFETWIRGGAPMPADAAPRASVSRRFWSLLPPQDVPIPRVQRANQPRNAIDHFILAKLEEKGLALSPQADKRTLIRRITYDLTGLPPTVAEIEAFLADQSPDAYANVVDRLLASPRYGERWGRYWLDVARYSDARNVGERFPFSYTYRDWVIRALNEDMPYDRFITLQLAADLLPHTKERRDLAALGYLSLGREFPKSFAETVDDRIDVVARGMLGLTVACARCHDHKYDPIPTKDYYSWYSILSNIREPAELPLLNASAHRTALDDLWEPRLQRIRKIDLEYRQKRCAVMITFFKTQIADYLLAARDSHQLGNTEIEELVRDRQLNLHLLRRWRQRLADSQTRAEPVFQLWHILAAIPNAGFAAKAKPAIEAQTGGNAQVTEAFRKSPPASIRDAASLYASVLLRHDRAESFANSDEEALRLALRGPNAAVNVPLSEFELIYTEGDGNNTRDFQARYDTTRTLYAYLGAAPRAMALEDVPSPVIAHVFVRGNANNPGAETPPHFLSCLSAGNPAPFHEGSGRLELAHAIASKDNPLTARVIVNRVWLHHFGAGIVRSPSDFGLRGDPPSHPELLDYLAIRFMESGWSLKKLHRVILLSATYQQSSQDDPEARRQDSENQLLWRMNRQRLDIEALRDSLLAVSGQLDLSAGGPPFSLTAMPAVPRRTVYGYIERGRVPVFLSSFDFASPDQHVPIRYSTTVPQQALFLLNSTFVAEQARRLAQRSETDANGDPAKRIQMLYRSVFGRTATPHEVELGERFVAAPSHEEPPAAPASAWQYGFGEFGASAGRMKSFTPFNYFDESWQGAPTLPDPISGSARLRAAGGQPGEDPQHAVIRRWVSPVTGKIDIEGSLSHDQTDLPTGDGVRARIVSSRHGELASWIVNGSGAEAALTGITVEKGDAIDFVVDGRADTENDAFTWAPKIRLEGAEKEWNASADFRGPTAKPLSVWERYAQVLLETNEFAFVD
ncbi:MAG TPA: DUF1549 and DUF1553 domain-containing protein [Candidatus Acidoferrales bacterium]|nr:DUF1549 and DUF1553 domain-containing protein [Candidatus Acidoferrales bacterium]